MNKKLILVLMAFFVSLGAKAATTIDSLHFEVVNGVSRLDIKADSDLNITRQENIELNQIVLEVQDATLGPQATRQLDTSSFDSQISLISPYQVEGVDGLVKIVVQLRQNAQSDLVVNGNSALLTINGDAVAQPAAETLSEIPEDPFATPDASTEADPFASLDTTTPVDTATATDPVAAEGDKSMLEQFQDNKDTKRFTGSPVTIQVRDADVKDVFRLVGDASGFNIILDPDVTGKVTLSLVDVPWDQALDVILNTLKLGAERNNNILRVLTLDNMAAEKKAILAAKQAAESVAPRVTRLFPISYANPDELAQTLVQFGNGQSSGSKAVVTVDKRTNSILIQDIPKNLDRMAKIVELLDKQTPQVMIEAKIIEAKEGFSKQIGGSIGFGHQPASSPGTEGFASFNGANPIDNLFGGVFSSGANAASEAGAARFGFSPRFGLFGGSQRLNAILNIGESESKLKVVTSPKAVVLNKEKATITQTIPVLVPSIIETEAGPQTLFEVQDAKIELTVQANVTNDESVLLDVQVSRDVKEDLGANGGGIGKRSVNSKVLVENGSTLVMGGVYIADKTNSESGLPGLRNIPIIGALFGEEREQTTRSELFVFVTPKILNTKKAGF